MELVGSTRLKNALLFNRPFLVLILIRDEPTGAILFTARVAAL